MVSVVLLTKIHTKIQSVRKTKQSRLMLVSTCAISDKKKSTFIKNHELSNNSLK